MQVDLAKLYPELLAVSALLTDSFGNQISSPKA